jgi:hypothetical protein
MSTPRVILLISTAIAILAACVTDKPEQLYQVGDIGPAGGIIIYSEHSLVENDNWAYMEVAPDAMQGIWGTEGTAAGINEDELGNGDIYTMKIIAVYGEGDYAAKTCDELVLNGYDDWYLPDCATMAWMSQYYCDVIANSFPSGWYWSTWECNYDSDYIVVQALNMPGWESNLKKGNSLYFVAVRKFGKW